MTKNEKSKYVRTALKAERWIEKWAEKEMKKHFNGIKYTSGYYNESGEYFTKGIKKMIWGK